MKCGTPAFDRALDQRPRFDGIVEIVAERVGDRIRYDDRAGEMDDRVDLVLAQQARDQILVADIAFDEIGLGAGPPSGTRSTDCRDDHTSSPASRSSSTIWLPI